LKNNTAEDSDNSFGDVKTAVNVFRTMKQASVNMPLGENLIPVSILTISLPFDSCSHIK